LAIANKREAVNGTPSHIYNKVWAENGEFLKDRALFDPSYFDFMLNISKLVTFQPVYDYSIDPDDIQQRIHISILLYKLTSMNRTVFPSH
jgi:hypothetical protein